MKIIVKYNDIVKCLNDAKINKQQFIDFFKKLKEGNQLAIIGDLSDINHSTVKEYKTEINTIAASVPTKLVTRIPFINQFVRDENCDILLTSNIHDFMQLNDGKKHILCLPLDADNFEKTKETLEKLVSGVREISDILSSEFYQSAWEKLAEIETKSAVTEKHFPSERVVHGMSNSTTDVPASNNQRFSKEMNQSTPRLRVDTIKTVQEEEKEQIPIQIPSFVLNRPQINTPLKEPAKSKTQVYPSTFKKKMKLIKKKLGAIIIGSSLLIGGATGVIGYQMGVKAQSKDAPYLPYEYALTQITETVSYDDTIESIASKYFDAAIYAGIYHNIDEYIDAILNQNDLKGYSLIHPGDTLVLPVVTNTNNQYFIKIHQLTNQIKQIEKENLWLKHVVSNGESYSYLAALASGSTNETTEIQRLIMEKNNNEFLKIGDIIWIMNPELGPLKGELKTAEIEFLQTLTKIKFVENEKNR